MDGVRQDPGERAAGRVVLNLNRADSSMEEATMKGRMWSVAVAGILGTALLVGPVGAQGGGPCGGGRWGQGAGQGRGYCRAVRGGGQGQGQGNGVRLRRRDGSCLAASGSQGQGGEAQRAGRGAGRGYGYGNGPRDGRGPNANCPLKK